MEDYNITTSSKQAFSLPFQALAMARFSVSITLGWFGLSLFYSFNCAAFNLMPLQRSTGVSVVEGPLIQMIHRPSLRFCCRLHAFSVDDDEYSVSAESVEDKEMSDEDLEASMGEWDERIARFNTIHLTGRVGNDPEPRYFDDGKVVVNISLATKRKYHGMERKMKNMKSGEEETDWYGLEIWGQTAEFVSKFVDKGARVGVIGQLQMDTWTDKATGEPRNRAKIVVRDLDVLETRAEAELRRGGSRRSQSFDSDNGDDYGPSRAGTGGFFDS